MMHPGFWNDAKRIFDEALAIDPARRDAFVVEACGSNADLLAEVRSLLSWHDDSVLFLERPIARVAEIPFAEDPDLLIGQTLGPWRIVGVIGHGGMGMVYRAERADEAFRREVAIKVVRRGVQAQGVVRRFKRERETLAALDHPNIARVFDGGATASGDPYFVMEYVDGTAVDRYCDEHRLSIDERLRLFIEICRGVQYAHQNFVVHRDLKPDNILVSRDGVPKLLDFGIARLLLPGTSADEDAAHEATWIVTPDFASPEQMAGRAVTAAADVYSLGVLLHVLLTGERPYHLAGTTPERLQRELSAAAVVPPSAHIDQSARAIERAAARSTTPRQLARRLAGDLDAIVSKAISRDAASRYATVEQLIADLERHHRREVVLARRRDPWYVAIRFLQRHELAVAVTATILLVIGAGVWAVLWQASIATQAQARAERRFQDLRQLAHTFMFDVHDEIAHLPGSTRAREILVRTGSNYVQRLLHEAEHDVDLQRELAAAFVKLGDAQGHPNSANLGDTTSARASYEQAIAITGTILAASPDDLDARRTLALAHRRRADVLAWTGALEAALAGTERSREEFKRLASMPGATGADRLQAIVSDIKLGDILGNPILPSLGRHEEAMPMYEHALTALRTALVAAPGDQQIRRYIGIALERIGTLHQQATRWDAAAASYRESLEVRSALAAEAPLHTDIQRDLAVAYEKIGDVELFSRRPAQAVVSYRGALEGFQKLAAVDPSNATAIRSVAIVREHLADAHRAAGARGEAILQLTEAGRLHRSLVARDGQNVQARCDVARLDEKLADVGTRPGDACASWRSSLATLEGLSRSGIACATSENIERLRIKVQRCR
jgi:serine/threonine protein kinase/tetratricopeptide (TPR) repeat protein